MTRQGRWRLAVWLLFIAGCVYVIARTAFNTDMSAFLPRSPTPTQQILVEQLRDGVVSRLILAGIEGADTEELARISKAMVRQLHQESELAAVNNGEMDGQQKDFDLLWKYRFLLSPAVTPEHYTADGLRASLLNDLDLLASPMGALVQRVLPGDPGGELVGLVDQLAGQSRPAMQEGVWFSRDGTRAMLLVQTRAAGSDLDAQEHAMQTIERAFESARQGVATARLRMTGPSVFSVQSRASIRDDAKRLSLIATVLVALLLLLVYRSPRALVLGLLPVASGALAGVAAVSLGFGSVHGITLGFGVTLIGEGVDYAIYLFTQIAPHSSARSTLQRIWPTLRLGVLTSVCGFSAMLFSGFTGLAQLGLFSIAGLLVAVSVSRWLLPELLPVGFFVQSGGMLSGAVMRMVHFAPRLRLPLILGVLVLLVALLLRQEPMWNDNLSGMSPVSQELQALDAQLRSDMGAPDVRYMIVLSAADQEQVLQRSEGLTVQLQQLVQRGMLQGFEAPSQVLPSQRTQSMRRSAIPDAAELRRSIAQASHGLPFRPGLFDPFLQAAAAARQQPLLEAEALAGSNLGLKLDTLLLKRASGWAAMLPLRGVQDADALTQGLAAQPDVILLDMKRETEHMFREYRHDAAQNALLGALAILLLLAVSLRSVRRVAGVTLPLVAAVIVVTAGLAWSGHTLTLFHLVGLLLVVAIGSNYSLFFDRESGAGQGMGQHHGQERTVISLLFANLSTIIGFGLLSFSQAPVLSAIGSTVALGAFLSLVFSAILITG